MQTKLIPLLLLLTPFFIHAQCELPTTRITVFKNATVFIEKAGTCPVSDKKIQLGMNENIKSKEEGYDRAAPAGNHIIFGSLAVSAKNNPVVATSLEKQNSPQAIRSILELLEANLGKSIQVFTKEDGQRLNGILQATGTTSGPSLLIQTGARWQLIPLEDVLSFEFTETPTTSKPQSRERIVVELEKAASSQEVSLSYLQKGITWTPNYFINILDKENLELELRATVANDVEDLNKVSVNLAVGIPVFHYAGIGDPLFSQQPVLAFTNALSSPGSGNYTPMANMTMQRYAPNIPTSYDSYTEPDQPEREQEDIFIYPINPLDLDKGGRIIVPVLKTRTTYENLYIVELKGSTTTINRGGYSEEEANTNYVWHSIKFNNKAGVPLTTGSVFFSQPDGTQRLPISQGTLNYTPVDKETLVKMAVSPNVIVSDTEVETNRKNNIIRNRDLVTIEGKISIANLKQEGIRLEVRREIIGKVLDSDHDWQVLNTTRNLNSLNLTNEVKWTLDLKAGEKQTVTYSYEIYVN